MIMQLDDVRKALDWEPLMVPAPAPSDWNAWAHGEPTETVEDPTSSVLLRDGQVLSRVSSKYHPFHNRELLRLVEQANNEGWLTDSVLEFGGGKTVAVNLVDSETVDNEHQLLTTLVNSFTGREALKLLPVDRRVFCANQLPYYSGQRAYRQTHASKSEFPSGVFASIRKDLHRWRDEMDQLREVKMNFGDYIKRLIERAVDTEGDNTRIVERRTQQLEQAYHHPTAPEPGTAYAALQATLLADQKIIAKRGWRTHYGSELSQLGLGIVRSELVSLS